MALCMSTTAAIFWKRMTSSTSSSSLLPELPNTPPKLIRNVYGGAVDGPILKDRLFFFAELRRPARYEGHQRQRRHRADGSFRAAICSMSIRTAARFGVSAHPK
jgi:hypothetical protein